MYQQQQQRQHGRKNNTDTCHKTNKVLTQTEIDMPKKLPHQLNPPTPTGLRRVGLKKLCNNEAKLQCFWEESVGGQWGAGVLTPQSTPAHPNPDQSRPVHTRTELTRPLNKRKQNTEHTTHPTAFTQPNQNIPRDH